MNKSFKGLDVGKIVFAISIVALHAGLFLDLSKELYIFLMRNVYTSAVPYFFMCSGFLCEHKLNNNLDSNYSLKCNIKHLVKVLGIWGSIYLCLSFGRDWISGVSIKSIIIDLIHKILILSPGGGMWYVSALLILEIILYFISKDAKTYNKKLTYMGVIFFALWSVSKLGNIGVFHTEFFARITDLYMRIFLSTNNFMFFGIWFVMGITFYRRRIKYNFLYSFGGFILLIVLKNVFFDNILIDAIVGFLYNYFIFMLFYTMGDYVKIGSTKQIRNMSSIIYFTHMAVIMVVEFGFLFFKGYYYGCETPIFIISICFLLIYSLVLASTSNKILKRISQILY